MESGKDASNSTNAENRFLEDLKIYREHIARCQSYWKDCAMLAIFPSMWLGLRTQQTELHENTEAMFVGLKEKAESDPSFKEEIPEHPEKNDPFRLDK